MALKSRQTTLSPLNEMFDGSKTKSQASSSTSAYMKAVETSDVINHQPKIPQRC